MKKIFIILVCVQVLFSSETIDFVSVRKMDDINRVMSALYGETKFASIQEDDKSIELKVPTWTLNDASHIPVEIKTATKIRSFALLRAGLGESFILYRKLGEPEMIDESIEIRMWSKATLFAVIETVDGKLYYTKAFIDIPLMSCMAK